MAKQYSTNQLYDLSLAGYLQVYLHQLHLDDTATLEGIAGLHTRLGSLVDKVAQLPVAAHPTAPALLAALRPLAQLAAGAVLPAPELKQELEKQLYLALRRVLAPGSLAVAPPPAFAHPAEFATRLAPADQAAWA